MAIDVSKNTVIKSLIWKFMERCGVQGVQFVLSIILARLIAPADYGLLALLLVFIQIANVFIQSGFNTALIQKKEADEIDFSSVFYFSLFVAALLYTLLYFTSPLIAIFFKQDKLSPLLRVLSITLFFGAVNSVQAAYVSKNMQFKRFFFSNMGAIIISGTFGLILALKGNIIKLTAKGLAINVKNNIIKHAGSKISGILLGVDRKPIKKKITT